jgi:hypothetical protein
MAKPPFHIVSGVDLERQPKLVRRAIEVCKRLPFRTIIDTRELARRLEVSVGTMCNCTAEIPKEYTVLQVRTRLYGNPKTIQAFNKWRGLQPER